MRQYVVPVCSRAWLSRQPPALRRPLRRLYCTIWGCVRVMPFIPWTARNPLRSTPPRARICPRHLFHRGRSSCLTLRAPPRFRRELPGAVQTVLSSSTASGTARTYEAARRSLVPRVVENLGAPIPPMSDETTFLAFSASTILLGPTGGHPRVSWLQGAVTTSW